MAEMLIQSESLTSIADKIRVLSGTESSMSLDDMETHIGEANTDVATEAGLIAQIASALEGKAADTGSSSGSIPTVMYGAGTITSTAAGGSVIYTTVGTDGKLYTNYYGFNTFPIAGLYLYTLPPELAINTPIFILSSGTITLSGATLITSGTGYAVYKYEASVELN